MKANLVLTGNVELDEKEVLQALIDYVVAEDILLDVINRYLAGQNLVATRVLKSEGSKGLRVRADVKSLDSEGGASIARSPLKKRIRRVSKGFKKNNLGFAHEVTLYLEKQRKTKRKSIPFDEFLQAVLSIFPDFGGTMTPAKRLRIYLADPKFQKSRNIEYDGRNSLIKIL